MKTYVKPNISVVKIDETPIMAGSGSGPSTENMGFNIMGDGGTSGSIDSGDANDGRAFSKKNSFFDE